MRYLDFLVTSMGDRKRCGFCWHLVKVDEIDYHATLHGYLPESVRVEPGVLV